MRPEPCDARVRAAELVSAPTIVISLAQHGNEDDWLETYTSSLSNLGSAMTGMEMVKSSFKEAGV